MRIAIINSVYDYGSTGHIIAKLAKGFQSAGHECHVLYSRNNTIDDEYIHRFYSGIGFIVHGIAGVLFDRHGLYSKTNTKKILNELDQIKPDVVNLHNLHGFYIHYPMLFDYLRSHRIPILYTLHDCWSFTGYCSHFTRSGCQQWKNGCQQCTVRDVYPYRILSNSRKNYLLKQACYRNQKIHLVVPSNWLKSIVAQSMWHDAPISVIPTEIDTSIFNRDSIDENFDLTELHLDGYKIILSVASIWTKAKGEEDLGRLAQLLDDPYRVVMIGKTNKKLPRITYIDHRDAKTLSNWYRKADCFVNCSYEDTFPTVNREALACGCPVITYDTGGCRELCNSSLNVVEPGNIERIAQLIQSKSYEHFVPQQNQMDMVAAYLSCLNELVEGNEL